jgi:hypothetical protein
MGHNNRSEVSTQRPGASLHCHRHRSRKIPNPRCFSPPCREQRRRAASRYDHYPKAGARGARNRQDARQVLFRLPLGDNRWGNGPPQLRCLAGRVRQTARSQAEVAEPPRDVRFSPESRHRLVDLLVAARIGAHGILVTIFAGRNLRSSVFFERGEVASSGIRNLAPGIRVHSAL